MLLALEIFRKKEQEITYCANVAESKYMLVGKYFGVRGRILKFIEQENHPVKLNED